MLEGEITRSSTYNSLPLCKLNELSHETFTYLIIVVKKLKYIGFIVTINYLP